MESLVCLKEKSQHMDIFRYLVLTVIMRLFEYCSPSCTTTIAFCGIPDTGSKITPKEMSPSATPSYGEFSKVWPTGIEHEILFNYPKTCDVILPQEKCQWRTAEPVSRQFMGKKKALPHLTICFLLETIRAIDG